MDLVVFENCKLDFLFLVFVLLWRRVVLLLALLGAAAQTKDKVKRRLLLNVVVAECTTIFQLLPRKYQSLLVRWNSCYTRRNFRSIMNESVSANGINL